MTCLLTGNLPLKSPSWRETDLVRRLADVVFGRLGELSEDFLQAATRGSEGTTSHVSPDRRLRSASHFPKRRRGDRS